MKTGKVKISLEYVVDLEDEEMVQNATNALYEDLMNAVKYNELASWITTEEDPNADEGDIPEFLLENKRDREQVDLDILEYNTKNNS